MDFPAFVYRSASQYLQVQDASEHAAALADGWFASVPGALAPRIERQTEPAPLHVEQPVDEPAKRGPGRPKKA